MITSRIKERFYRREPTFSLEFFPPKNEKGEEALREALAELAPLDPTFVSVTYGAGGSTRERTKEIVCSLKQDYGLTAMAHVTCIGHTLAEVRGLLEDYAQAGVSDILALRGDPPRGDTEWKLVFGGPEHAIDVVRMAKAMGAFSIGVAGFPEKHPEAHDLDSDLHYLLAKVQAGADFVVTQLFFDNDAYFNFVSRARRLGITVPIIPGIMPITRAGQIERFTAMCNCWIPDRLARHIAQCGDDENRVQEIGLAYCSAQCADLLRRGAPGIHFYTLNKSRACQTVYAALNALGLWNP